MRLYVKCWKNTKSKDSGDGVKRKLWSNEVLSHDGTGIKGNGTGCKSEESIRLIEEYISGQIIYN